MTTILSEIKLHFSTLDGISKTKTFKTLKGARKAAHNWVGADADVGSSYAVSVDGVVTVRVDGATLQDIFSKDAALPKKTPPVSFDVPCVDGARMFVVTWYFDDGTGHARTYATYDDALDACAFERGVDDDFGAMSYIEEYVATRSYYGAVDLGSDYFDEWTLAPHRQRVIANDEIPF
jgi:hypothetical protein